MSNAKVRPTVDEIYALLKNTTIPTVLVEGKDDIIFYRRLEDDLEDIGIDMLPAGNKGSVLELRELLKNEPVSVPVAFVVDKDLWVYFGCDEGLTDIITTDGYSIENDLFIDGALLDLMSREERETFNEELLHFLRWYALTVTRSRQGQNVSYRESAFKVLNDNDFYDASTQLADGEQYPEDFYNLIHSNYGRYLRGKSLFALIVRQLSHSQRQTKFSTNQLMEVGAARQGERYITIRDKIRQVFAAPETT